MKHFLLLFFVLPITVYSQDTIFLKGKETIPCKIKMVTPQVISYITPDGQERVIQMDDVKKKKIHSPAMMKKGDVVVYGDKNSEGYNFVWSRTDSVKKSKSQIYSDTKMFIAEQWRSAQNVIQNDDKESGVIIIKGVEILKWSEWGTNTYTYRYSVIFKMKDNRYKIEIKDVYCDDAYFSGTKGINKITKIDPFEGECPEGFSVWTMNIYCDAAQDLMINLRQGLQSIVNSYSDYINKPSPAEDW